MLNRSFLKRKKPDKDSPAAKAFARVKEIKESKEKPKEYSRRMGVCWICGIFDLLDPHHIWRRSLRPDLVNVKANIAYLCRKCHKLVTINRDAEKEVQEKFYPNPPKFKAKNEI
jgi:5-methylcytosine-specific restriction endonuclease McrA